VKILLIVIAGVVLLVLAVVVIGLLLPKRYVVTRSASYRAKPERLFSLITGPQDWRPDVVRCETVPDINGRELVLEATRDSESITYELLDRTPTSIKRRIATENLLYSGHGLSHSSPAATFSPSGSRKMARCTTQCSASCRGLFLAIRARWTLT